MLTILNDIVKPELGVIMVNDIVKPELGVIMLNNIVNIIEQCWQ